LSARPELVLFTAEYPFGNTSEPFLETEIEVLAERFSRIYVLASHQEEGVRAIPANVELVEMDWPEEPARRSKQRSLASRDAARVLLWTLGTPGDLRAHVASRMYLDILARNILKFRSLNRFVRERHLGRAIFYDYWFENSTLALALLRKSGAIGTAVARAHGFDVYEERWDGSPVPFRQAKAKGLDAVFAVSRAGRTYLEERVPGLRGKVRVQRLGVRDPGLVCPADMAATPLIVTCGNLIPIKRVHLVPEVLTRLGRPVRWVHLGDGPDRARVERAISRAGHGDQWTLRGHVDNSEVLRFYGRSPVSALLSLSESEGLPVSMMEAQSYGIPVVACEVGGVAEIVNESTGVLLDVDASPAEMAAGLGAALEPRRFDRGVVRRFFRDRFEARSNYNAFADALIELHERQAPAA